MDMIQILFAVFGMTACAMVATAVGPMIPLDDVDQWKVEVWCGSDRLDGFVCAKMDGLALVDHDIFACRVDPDTLMPTGEPALVAGGDIEPGGQTVPALASLGHGESLLAYQAVDASGQSHIEIRRLAGGATQGPPRTGPRPPEPSPK